MYSYIVLTFLAASTTSILLPKQKGVQYRLPQDVVMPENYNLELTLGTKIFIDYEFQGTLDLRFKVLKNTSEIKLHASPLLQMTKTPSLTSENGKKIELTKENFLTDNITEILTIETVTPLEADSIYILHFNYTGKLIVDELYGFYKSTYHKPDGSEQPLATSMFEPTFARRVFPCFDEPVFKATFDVKIRHESKFNALGNTKRFVTSDPENSDFSITTFNQTPIMSTHLVAFVVSDFTCDEDPDRIVPHQICSRADATGTRKLSLDLGSKFLKAIEEFTDIPYVNEAITKLDEVAIPDFAGDAMDNWGLITYREKILLWDEIESSNEDKQKGAAIMIHHLSHMWFGNLITPHWWSDLFLKEGFARYSQYFVAKNVYEDWELDKQFLLKEVQVMLEHDASQTSEPLSLEVSSPAEALARFNKVSYAKGAIILRMVEHIMGTSNFKRGITKFLKDHKYGNVKPKDLWTVLGEFTTFLPQGQTLESVMDNWVNKAGYPLLNIKVRGNDVIFSQKRFLTDESSAKDSEKWYVPLTWTKGIDEKKFEDTSPKTWLTPKGNLTQKDLLSDDREWIIFNNQLTGYYRVNYDHKLWNRIIMALHKRDFDGILDINRAQLIDDTYSLAQVGIKTFSHLLNFLRHFGSDDSYYTWYSTLAAVSNMLKRTGDKVIKKELSRFFVRLMHTVYRSVSKKAKDENQIYSLKRQLAFTWACRLGNRLCVKMATNAFTKYKKTGKKVDKDMKNVIYCTGLSNSENVSESWNFLWKQYLEVKLDTEKSTILLALGCVNDPTLLKGYLNKSINATSGIRSHDSSAVFKAVYVYSPEGIDVALDFFINNHEKIISSYGSLNSLDLSILGLADRFTRQEQLNKLQDFLKQHEKTLPESLFESGKKAVKNAQANLKITKRLESEMKHYFPNRAETVDNSSSTLSSKVTLRMVMSFLLIFCQLLILY